MNQNLVVHPATSGAISLKFTRASVVSVTVVGIDVVLKTADGVQHLLQGLALRAMAEPLLRLVGADRKLTHLNALCRLKTDPGVLLLPPNYWAGELIGDHHGNVRQGSADVSARSVISA